jgi:radical SAM superfamily enzyme YgiQ (UPF0313 family)
MKLKIIFPKREDDWFNNAVGRLAMPAAPTYLAAITPPDNDITIIDIMGGDTIDYNEEVDLVAMTVRTPAASDAYKIADEFRRRRVTVVLGGPHVTTLPLEAKGHADAIVIGEADDTWSILLQDFHKNKLRDFYIAGPFNTDGLQGQMYHIPHRPSLKGLPHLRRDLLPRNRYRMDSIFTSRGCPHKCFYCSTPWLFGGQFRHRPIDEVIAEIETLPSSYFNIDDSIFGSTHDHQYFLDLYGELAKLSKKRYWVGQGALGAVAFEKGQELLKRASASGLFRLVVGIESVHGPGLIQAGAWEKAGFRKGEQFKVEKMKNAVKIIQDYGITVQGFFIIGFDADTPGTILRTLDFCRQTDIIPMITILSPFPDAPLYRKLASEDRLLPNLNWDKTATDELIFKHPTMSGAELKSAKDAAMKQLYELTPILKRVTHSIRRRPHPMVFFSSLFSQLGLRKGIKHL